MSQKLPNFKVNNDRLIINNHDFQDDKEWE